MKKIDEEILSDCEEEDEKESDLDEEVLNKDVKMNIQLENYTDKFVEEMDFVQKDIYEQFKANSRINFKYQFSFYTECRYSKDLYPRLYEKGFGRYAFHFNEEKEDLSIKLLENEDLTIEKINIIIKELRRFLENNFVIVSDKLWSKRLYSYFKENQQMEKRIQCWIQNYDVEIDKVYDVDNDVKKFSVEKIQFY
jgi:hypothetical protein